MHFRIYDCFTCKLARINQYCAPYICMHRVHLLILDILLPPVISSSNSLHFEVKKVQQSVCSASTLWYSLLGLVFCLSITNIPVKHKLQLSIIEKMNNNYKSLLLELGHLRSDFCTHFLPIFSFFLHVLWQKLDAYTVYSQGLRPTCHGNR